MCRGGIGQKEYLYASLVTNIYQQQKMEELVTITGCWHKRCLLVSINMSSRYYSTNCFFLN